MDANTTLAARDDSLYQRTRVCFLSWYLPLLLAVGLTGAGGCLVLLLRLRAFPWSVTLWLVSICAADLAVLSTDALRMAVKAMAGDFDLRDLSDAGCKLTVFLANFALYWSAFVQAAFSVQRLLAVLWPCRARALLTRRRVWAVWGSLLPLAALPNLLYLVSWRLSDDPVPDCEPRPKRLYRLATTIDLVAWGVLPLSVMVTSTLLLIRRGLRRKAFAWDVPPTSEGGRGSLGGASLTPQQRETRTAESRTITRLLVLLNVWYLCTTFPGLIYLMIYNFGEAAGIHVPWRVHKVTFYLLRLLLYHNAAFNWVFYVASGRLGRQGPIRALRRLCCLRDGRMSAPEGRDNFAFRMRDLSPPASPTRTAADRGRDAFEQHTSSSDDF